MTPNKRAAREKVVSMKRAMSFADMRKMKARMSWQTIDDAKAMKSSETFLAEVFMGRNQATRAKEARMSGKTTQRPRTRKTASAVPLMVANATVLEVLTLATGMKRPRLKSTRESTRGIVV